jgi:hypothetical protein
VNPSRIFSWLPVAWLAGVLTAPVAPAADTGDWQVQLLGRDQPVSLRDWIGKAPCAFVVIARGDARNQEELISRGADNGVWPLPAPTVVPRMVLVLDDGPWPGERLLAADWGRPTADTRELIGDLAHGTLFLLGRGGRRLAAFGPQEKQFATAVPKLFEQLAEEDPSFHVHEWLGVEPWTADTANALLNAALSRYADDRWESRSLILETCAWITDRSEDEGPEVEVAKFAGAIQSIMARVPRDRGTLETFARQSREQLVTSRGFAASRAEAALTMARIEAGHRAAVKNDPSWLLLAARIALLDPGAKPQVWLDQALAHPRLTPALREEAERLRQEIK